jgi:hypothetical protein
MGVLPVSFSCSPSYLVVLELRLEVIEDAVFKFTHQVGIGLCLDLLPNRCNEGLEDSEVIRINGATGAISNSLKGLRDGGVVWAGHVFGAVRGLRMEFEFRQQKVEIRQGGESII